jgi:hypothetical protein
MAKAKAPKPKKIKCVQYTKIVLPGRRVYGYLDEVVDQATKLNNYGNIKDFDVATTAEHVIVHAQDCDETFWFPKSVIAELAEAVK